MGRGQCWCEEDQMRLRVAIADKIPARVTAEKYGWPLNSVKVAYTRIRKGGPFYRWAAGRYTSATEEKQEEVTALVKENPRISIRQCVQHTGLPRTTVWHVCTCGSAASAGPRSSA